MHFRWGSTSWFLDGSCDNFCYFLADLDEDGLDRGESSTAFSVLPVGSIVLASSSGGFNEVTAWAISTASPDGVETGTGGSSMLSASFG